MTGDAAGTSDATTRPTPTTAQAPRTRPRPSSWIGGCATFRLFMALAAETAGGSSTPCSKPLRLIPLAVWRRESPGMACGARRQEVKDDRLLAPCWLLPYLHGSDGPGGHPWSRGAQRWLRSCRRAGWCNSGLHSWWSAAGEERASRNGRPPTQSRLSSSTNPSTQPLYPSPDPPCWNRGGTPRTRRACSPHGPWPSYP